MRDNDVFLSFSSSEAERVKQIHRRLSARGLSVFMDQADLGPAQSVSAEVENALRTSKTCVFYYSKRFAVRHACQFELAQAFISDAAEGGATRLLVINPERNKAHIAPVELQDRLYIQDDQSDEGLDKIARYIETWASGVTGTFRDIDFDRLPRSHGKRPGMEPRVRRYSAMWALHSALNRHEYKITQEPAGTSAILVGMSGSGKTKLVEDYALHFGHAFTDVLWFDLHDHADDFLVPYTKEIAKRLGLRTGAASRPRDILDAARGKLAGTEGRLLWVVDNVPADLDLAQATDLVSDLGHVRTVLITHQRAYEQLGDNVELTGLTEEEGMALFVRSRQTGEDELPVVASLVKAVQGHPMAIAQLAQAATERSGLTSLIEHAGRVLDDSSRTVDQVSMVFADRLAAIEDDYQVALLRLAVVCAPEPLPIRFTRDCLLRLGLNESRILDAISALGNRLLVGRADGHWHVHPVVRRAVRRQLADVAAENHIAGIAAECLADYADLGQDEMRLRHARQLVDRPHLPLEIVDRLLLVIARGLRDTGRPGSAARYFDRLIDRSAVGTDVVVEAAQCHLDAGEYEEAARLAGPASGSTAALISAEALDAMGRFDQAEASWDQVGTPAVLGSDPRGADLEARLRWIRSRRLRGVMRDNRAFLTGLLAREHELPDLTANAARLELANIQMQTDAQREARVNARKVVQYHRERGQLHHPQAVEAQFVLASADLLIYFLEFKPDAGLWPEAEKTFRKLAEQQEQELGARNVQVLATKVAIVQSLISQGKAMQARTCATRLLKILRSRLADGHPLVLRCMYVLGMAHFQLADFGAATACLDQAHIGQLAAFGPYHQETLRTQFELGMALKMGDDPQRGNALLDNVRIAAPKVTGRVHDLYGQALVGSTLGRYAPAWALRMAHRANHKDKWTQPDDACPDSL